MAGWLCPRPCPLSLQGAFFNSWGQFSLPHLKKKIELTACAPGDEFLILVVVVVSAHACLHRQRPCTDEGVHLLPSQGLWVPCGAGQGPLSEPHHTAEKSLASQWSPPEGACRTPWPSSQLSGPALPSCPVWAGCWVEKNGTEGQEDQVLCFSVPGAGRRLCTDWCVPSVSQSRQQVAFRFPF